MPFWHLISLCHCFPLDTRISTLPLEDRCDPSQSPSHHPRSQILKSGSCQSFGKNIPKLFNRLNFKQPHTTFLNLLSEPNGLNCIVLAHRSKLWWDCFRKNQSSSVIFVNRDMHRHQIFCLKTHYFTNLRHNIHNREQLSTTMRQRDDLRFHR